MSKIGVKSGGEIPVLKEAFKEYEPVHETAAFQSKEDALPGFIGSSPYEKEALINAEKTKKKAYGSSATSKPQPNGDIGVYPPGFSVTGSSNLPVPEVDPNVITKTKKRKKRKNQVHEMSEDEKSNRDSSPASESPRISTLPQETENKLTQPPLLPTRLPPIVSKPAENSLPPIGSDVTNLDPIEKGMGNHHVEEGQGLTNEAFVSDESESPEKKAKEEIDMSFVNNREESLCFDDKQRKIDYVLVYKVEDEDNDEEKDKASMRELYQENLKKLGAHLEIEPKEKSQDQKTCFVKLHVPWHILLKYAERMKLKMPLKVEKDEDEQEHDPADDSCCDCSCFGRLKKKLMHPFKLHNDLINETFGDQEFYTAEFTQDKINYFDIEDKETFFSNPERSRIGSVDKHASKTANMRQLLYREWARWGRWYKFQPLDAIRNYLSDKIALYFSFLQFYTLFLSIAAFVGFIVFIYGLATVFTTPLRYYLGDKVGLYFAWLGFYTHMLFYVSFIGVICLLYGIGTLSTYPPVQEICDENDPFYAGNVTMCPLCDTGCHYWKLKTACLATRITYVFDNEATIFFAVFMSLWATFFLEFWKRRQFELAYEWDLVDFDEERDLVRPEYEAQVDRERFNPATGKMESMMAPRDKFQRISLSIATVLFWVGLIVVAVFAIIVYRVVMHTVFALSVDPATLGVVGDVASPSMLTTITSSLISLIIILLLNKLYAKVALALTNWEIPRTRTEFEDSFTMKIFCFQFVNFYAFLFYIAFFKNTFTGHPGNYNYLFGRFRWEGCEAGGCMYELTVQLLIIMFGKQTFNNIMELIVPWALNKYRKRKSEKVAKEEPENTYTRWEMDFDLAPLELDLFYEYLEMVIQFGFVTLFVAAFPLAPLLALLNNIIEIRLDAIKFITQFRRPLALKASDIGAWYFLLEFIGILAVVTNAFTIAITSEAIPKLVYFYFYSTTIFPENTYVGYINDSLSVFNVDNLTDANGNPIQPPNLPGEDVRECRYKDYRTPPTADPAYQLSLQYWHILAARFAFVIVMEHVVFFLKSFFDYVIPDRPKKLTAQIKREYYLVQNMLMQAEKDDILSKYGKALSELETLYRQLKEPDGPKQDGHELNTNASNGSGIVAYENEMKTTSM